MNEPIRVLNLFTIMNRGGAETMVMNYYRNIDRNKIQLDFLVHREEEGAYEKEILELGGRIYRMPPIYPKNFTLYKKKIKEFFKEHPEYKIIHSHMSELGYFAFKEAKRQNIPVRICHAHNAPHGFDLKMIVRNYFKHAMMPYITHMFTCGKEAGDWLFGKRNSSNVIMLNNAVDAKKFIYDFELSKKLKKDMNLENKFIIGHIGRFNKQKNHMFLIDIFNEIQKMDKSARLILVGMGEEEDRIRNKVKSLKLGESVKFLGVRSDIHQLMQVFDVFLFPSLFEGLPVTLIEAQAAGLPCIISDSITNQCVITDMVKKVSLDKSAIQWAEELVEFKDCAKRKKTLDLIIKNKFDIKENAQWLTNFYCKSINNLSEIK
ncbi:glycosyltransferase family 1 protein [Thomasclavelia cocleata]|uniref:glycosyltransferase family 1 protein n=1 Tax=Thomasclavelia cocleata TaxID=69824 RepID=UPI0025A9632D|nr:glycosyltransferase family 1 protein [Thomasclavelia cocleata]